MTTALTAVTFEQDADQEHVRILQTKTRTAQACWELGARLLRFRETGEYELETALKIVRADAGAPRRSGSPTRVPSGEAEALAARLRDASGGILKTGQVMARKLGGHEVIDLRAIPVDQVPALLARLAAAIRTH